jgi:hypothetical protein
MFIFSETTLRLWRDAACAFGPMALTVDIKTRVILGQCRMADEARAR